MTWLYVRLDNIKAKYKRALITSYRPLGYERVDLPLCRVADTPFHIQGDDMLKNTKYTEGALTHSRVGSRARPSLIFAE